MPQAPGPDAQKKTLSAVEKLREDVVARTVAFLAEVADIDAHDLVFLDEAGAHRAMTRAYARSPRGERVHGRVPRNRGTVTTMLGAMTLDGIVAIATIEGATSGAVFCAFVEQVLLPTLRPGQVVVLDNLGAHQVVRARELVEAKGARLLFLPQYSPELNPIEEAWAKLKSILRAAEARTLKALDAAIALAADLITPDDAAGFFQHAGYQVNR